MAEPKTCDICGTKDVIIIRYPDGKGRCVKCAVKYETECRKYE